jgi:cytochrome c-type biogenesis protein CcmH
MSGFVAGAVVMTALALVWLLPALLRRPRAPVTAAAESNLAILRDQVAELERDAANGLVAPEQLASAREDLERRALEDAEAAVPVVDAGVSRGVAIVLVVAVPLLAGSLYWVIGNPEAITLAPVATAGAQPSAEQIEGMVKKLEARLLQSPEDGGGWAMLGRSYLVMQRYEDSAKAYARATALITDDAALFADYADAVAMAQGRRIEGKPLQLIEQALRLDPAQWKALAMAGSAAFERKDFAKAVGYWERLRKLPDLAPEFLNTVDSNIAEARRLGGGKLAVVEPPKTAAAKPVAGKPAATPASVSGTVKLDAALAAKAAPTDTVFIFARAAQGPRVPLAVMRRQVRDLPLQFTLDDSMAMASEMKLSNFQDVIVGARISKTANAMPQSGDLQGLSKPVKTGAANISIVIDAALP